MQIKAGYESLQADGHNKCHSNFEHFRRKNAFDVVYKSYNVDDDEHLHKLIF